MTDEQCVAVIGYCMVTIMVVVIVGVLYLIYLGMSAVMSAMSPDAAFALVAFLIGFSLGMGVKK